jgi:hypothetical protein
MLCETLETNQVLKTALDYLKFSIQQVCTLPFSSSLTRHYDHSGKKIPKIGLWFSLKHMGDVTLRGLERLEKRKSYPLKWLES